MRDIYLPRWGKCSQTVCRGGLACGKGWLPCSLSVAKERSSKRPCGAWDGTNSATVRATDVIAQAPVVMQPSAAIPSSAVQSAHSSAAVIPPACICAASAPLTDATCIRGPSSNRQMAIRRNIFAICAGASRLARGCDITAGSPSGHRGRLPTAIRIEYPDPTSGRRQYPMRGAFRSKWHDAAEERARAAGAVQPLPACHVTTAKRYAIELPALERISPIFVLCARSRTRGCRSEKNRSRRHSPRPAGPIRRRQSCRTYPRRPACPWPR